LLSFSFLLAVLSVLPVEIKAQPDKRQMEEAKKLVSEGDVLYRQKNYKAAIDKYDRATIFAMTYPLAYFSKGYAHYNLGEDDQAITAFNTALKQGYKPMDIYEIRWRAFYMKRDFDSALSDTQAAIRLAPSNPYYYLASGQIYHEKGSYQEAIDSYKKSIELGTTDADVNYYLAKSYNKAGQTIQQGLAGIEAIKKGTKFPGETWNLIGQALQINKKLEEAAEAYERSLIAKTDIYEVYGFLADIYRNLYRYDEAIATAKRGLRMYPNDGNLYTSLSWFYSLADKHVEAIGAAQQAIKLMPDQYMGYTNLCRAYNDAKLYPQAVQACTNALRINPGDGESNLYLARAYYSQNKTDLAAPLYKKAVSGLVEFTRNNPDYSDGFYLLGNAYYSDGRRPEAIAAYKKCLELSPKFAKARYNLGVLYFQAGDKSAAQAQYAELQKIDAVLADKLLQAINK
jgi:superkiller protein 3